MKTINTATTEKTMRDMAISMRRYADELDGIASSLGESGDLLYTGEAMSCVSNCILSLRLDLLVTHPIREYEKIVSGLAR